MRHGRNEESTTNEVLKKVRQGRQGRKREGDKVTKKGKAKGGIGGKSRIREAITEEVDKYSKQGKEDGRKNDCLTSDSGGQQTGTSKSRDLTSKSQT